MHQDTGQHLSICDNIGSFGCSYASPLGDPVILCMARQLLRYRQATQPTMSPKQIHCNCFAQTVCRLQQRPSCRSALALGRLLEHHAIFGSHSRQQAKSKKHLADLAGAPQPRHQDPWRTPCPLPAGHPAAVHAWTAEPVCGERPQPLGPQLWGHQVEPSAREGSWHAKRGPGAGPSCAEPRPPCCLRPCPLPRRCRPLMTCS